MAASAGSKKKTMQPKSTVTKRDINDAVKEMNSMFKDLGPSAKLHVLEQLGVGNEFFTCQRCGKVKLKQEFYATTDPAVQSKITNVCRQCAEEVASPVINGEKQEPTKETADEALYLLDKPMIDAVWESSINEFATYGNQVGTAKFKSVFSYYMKNISMKQYYTYTYKNSDGYTGGMLTLGTIEKEAETTENKEIIMAFEKNKSDVLRLLGYLPFDNEKISDQPFLYSQLLGFLDGSEDANDDMMRIQSVISIVRGFAQASNIDDMVAALSSDIRQAEKNVPTIRSLQAMKKDIMTSVVNLAKENCISLKNSKNSIKGENTWTGKIKMIKDINIRGSEVNGFDINTCKGMQQVQEISDASIMKQLALDESEWSDMVAEMRVQNSDLRKERDQYKEINRILLRENLDLKDYLEEKGIDIRENCQNLEEIYSPFGNLVEDDQEDNGEVEDDYFG